jgi:hypothetical protein
LRDRCSGCGCCGDVDGGSRSSCSDLGPWKHGVCPRPMDLNSVVLLVFTGGILLWLLQSFQAMVLPPVFGCWLLPLSGPGIVFFGIGFWQRLLPASQASRGLPKGFYVILVSSRGSYASSVGTAALKGCMHWPTTRLWVYTVLWFIN